MDVDAATQTMIDNVPAKTGRPLVEWFTVLDAAGPATHGQALALLKSEHGVSHGFANLVVRLWLERGSGPAPADDLADAQFAGRKEALRPVYDRVAAAAVALGDDVEVAPRKTAVALRRGKQFAYLEVPSATRLRVGLNLRGRAPEGRLVEHSGMCTHRVDVGSPDEVDDELVGWLREAYERA